MSLRVAVLLALLTLLPAGLAHGPGVGVTRARPVTSAEGAFLEMSVTAPATAGRHDLIAASTGDGAAAFERERIDPSTSFRSGPARSVSARKPPTASVCLGARVTLPGRCSR